MRIAARSLAPLLLSLLAACNDTGDTDTSSSITPETPDKFLEFLNDQQGQVYNPDWTTAYYEVVDPDRERRTLEDWKIKNGFGSCDDEFHIIFRDSKDLGYGRDMYACRYDADGIDPFGEGRFSIFVRNFVVKVLSGDPTNYGPINVEAAIEDDTRHHSGTNAIEFSPIDADDPDSDKVAKFFTFTPAGDLNISADLDGRGDKPMPQPCLLCHGATLLPWDTAAVIEEAGKMPGIRAPWDIPEVAHVLRSAKLNQLELETFDYSSLYPLWSRANQEERFRRFNQYVVDTYVDMSGRDKANPRHWCADFAIELGLGRYGAVADVAELCGAHNPVATDGLMYDEEFVPAGWQQTLSRPVGVDVLYKRVIEPHCISCHSLRGNAAGERVAAVASEQRGNAINFSSYENFIGYADIIKDYVYRRGAMPLSLRNYLEFWDNPDGAPAILASFLPGFDLYTTEGKVLAPGRPVAKPGVNRTVTSPVALDASASLYAGSYRWEVVEAPVGAIPVLSAPTAAQTLLTAGNGAGGVVDGDYVVKLTVVNVLGIDSAVFTVTVDSGLTPAPSDLTFYSDIRPILQNAPDGLLSDKNAACTDCHNLASAGSPLYQGLPVYYDTPVNDPMNPLADRNLYQDVMARVDLVEPENSILVRKPTREEHGGGKVLDLSLPGHYETYNRILNWIRNGAPCDSVTAPAPVGFCP